MISASSGFNAANALLVKQPIVALEIDGYSKIFTTIDTGIAGHYPWIVEVGDYACRLSTLDGSSSLDDMTVTVLDYQHLVTADMPGITLEGKICRVKTGFVGLAYADWLTIFTGEVDSVPSSSGKLNTAYDFVCKDTRLNLKQVIYLTGDDGKPTDSSHPKTVVGHPLNIAKSIFFDYLGLAAGDVNSAVFDAYRDELFAGMEFEFHITSAPEAKSFLESQIFKPLGGFLRSDNLGRLTPHFFQPLGGSVVSSMALNRDNIVGVPEVQQADLVNVVAFRFDYDGSNYLSETVQMDSASVAKYGQQGEDIIECDGVRSGFQGFFVGALTSNALFNRYGDKNPKFDLTAFWSTLLLEPGDFVQVTHSLMPDRVAGTMGVTNKWFEIEDKVISFADKTVTLTLVDASVVAKYGHYRIAPNGKPAWTLATAPDAARYMYISSAAGKYSDGSDGHTLA